MKICVVGAGAIGGLMGAKLALAGEDVTLIARGAHLEAIRQNGLKLIEEDGTEHVARQVKATSRLSEAGVQDIVILALKAHQVEPIAKELPALFGPGTIVVTTQNGIPWWYFQKHGGEFEGRRVETVDPSGTLMASVEVERILGCVVFPAAEIVSPGVVRVIEGNRFPVGELDGSESERVKMVTALFTRAGFKSPVLKNVRGEIWLKLWGNLSFNPISALTHSTLVDICQFPLTRQLAADMMTEAQTIANKLGIEFRVSLEKRIAGAENVGKHKTSMLQDIEIGRAPHIDAVYACVKLLAKTLAEEKGKLKVEKIG
ncbi:MAG: 2-dehydropantoate 2-reductase [Proteobacteria bacterium]|nr:2-dehydropantoate 2-reductase [Pseudomonadota bacterium]